MGQCNRKIRCRRYVEDQVQALSQVLDTANGRCSYQMSSDTNHLAVRSDVKGV